MLTSNISFAGWGNLLGGDEVLATALLDRLLHQAEGIPTKVVSMMINQSPLQQKRRNHQTPQPKSL